MHSNLLSYIVFLPLFFALAILILPENKSKYYKYLNLISALFQTVLSFYLYFSYKPYPHHLSASWSINRFSFVEKIPWIQLDLGSLGKLKIDYFIGVDGLNITLVLLSAIVMLIAAIASWHIEKKLKGYYGFILLLACSVPGCFVAIDFFLFYLFFELMLLPMYFLIGLWGGPRREYASIKFFLYTLFGSLFILIVMIALSASVIDPVETAVKLGLAENAEAVTSKTLTELHYLLAENKIHSIDKVHSFNVLYMTDHQNFIWDSILNINSKHLIAGLSPRLIAFLLLLIGFIVKLPSVPFHTWLPDAHVEAPTPISIILAGVLLKIGGYGIIRFAYGIFPEGGIYFSWYIGFVAVVSILYAAFVALAMGDIKKLIAYSSVSHMGFVLLGIASLTPEGFNGSIYQMFSHGIIASMLFLIAGVLYDRSHDRTIDYYRGLAFKMPVYTTFVTIAFFASLGLPGFSGFIAELFVLLGAFNSQSVNGFLPRWMAILATSGLLIGAAYYLWTLQRMFFGKFSLSAHLNIRKDLLDLSPREKMMFVPLAVITLGLGLFPGLIFDVVSVSTSDFVSYVLNAGRTYLK